jgi:hypothetical protein
MARGTLHTDDSAIDPVLLAQSAAARNAAALNAPARKETASWTLASETAMMSHLLTEAAASGDGTNFKKTTWQSTAVAVNKVIEKGAPKTADSCKNKYQKVRGQQLLLWT